MKASVYLIATPLAILTVVVSSQFIAPFVQNWTAPQILIMSFAFGSLVEVFWLLAVDKLLY